MKKDVEISFIIPCYNAEKYIKQCLDSVTALSEINYEVITVNDGSRDQTGEILRQYQRNNNRIVIRDQNNSGVSAARNNGLSVAQGEYIFFIDADDLLDADQFEKEWISSGRDQDIYVWGYQDIDENGIKKKKYEFNRLTQYKREQLDHLIISGFLLNTCWGKAFRRTFIIDNNILFPTDMRMGEDTVFVLRCMERTDRVMIGDGTVYQYRQLSSGAVISCRSDMSDGYIKDFAKVYLKKYKYAIDRKCSDESVNDYFENTVENISAYINLMIKASDRLQSAENNALYFSKDGQVRRLLKLCREHREISKKRKFLTILWNSVPGLRIYVMFKYLTERR